MAAWETMSVAEIDIWRSVKLLIDQHGDEAPIHAAMKADAMLDKGDLDGRATWLRVLKAVEELLDKGPPEEGTKVH